MADPRFIASTAADDSEPKLMPLIFTIEDGRNACFRPRCPPSTFAQGSGYISSGWVSSGLPNVWCLMMR